MKIEMGTLTICCIVYRHLYNILNIINWEEKLEHFRVISIILKIRGFVFVFAYSGAECFAEVIVRRSIL